MQENTCLGNHSKPLRTAFWKSKGCVVEHAAFTKGHSTLTRVPLENWQRNFPPRLFLRLPCSLGQRKVAACKGFSRQTNKTHCFIQTASLWLTATEYKMFLDEPSVGLVHTRNHLGARRGQESELVSSAFVTPSCSQSFSKRLQHPSLPGFWRKCLNVHVPGQGPQMAHNQVL